MVEHPATLFQLALICSLLTACKPSSTATSGLASNTITTNITANSTNLLDPELEIDIDKSSEHLAQGNIFLAEGKLSEAVEQFQLAVRFNPEDEELY